MLRGHGIHRPPTHIHIYSHTCIYIHHTYIQAYRHTYIHTYIYIHTYMHTYRPVSTGLLLTYTHTHTHIYIHTNIYTYIHTCIHTYIHTGMPRGHCIHRPARRCTVHHQAPSQLEDSGTDHFLYCTRHCIFRLVFLQLAGTYAIIFRHARVLM